MKNILKSGAIAVLGTLPQGLTAQQTVPGLVVSCYSNIYNDIVSGNINQSGAEKYINPENVLRSMRNPITPQLEQEVIDSALSFARFLERRMHQESGNYTSSDVIFTRYSERGNSTLLNGVVGGKYHFRMILEPGGECKILDFTVEGVRGMRDGIPRR